MWRIKPDKKKELDGEFKKRGIYGASRIATETKIPPASLDRMLKSHWFRASANLRRLFEPLVGAGQDEHLTVEALIRKYCEEGPKALPPPPPPPPPGKNMLTSTVGFPMTECMEGIAQANQVCFLSTWLVLQESLAQPIVERAMKHAVSTRILILDPESAHVAHRGMDLNSSTLAAMKDADDIKAAIEEARDDVRHSITTSLGKISARIPPRQNCEHLEVRVYDSTPIMTLLIMGGYVCQGPLRRDYQGSSLPHILYTQEQNPLLYQADMNHFNAIWNSRTTYRYDVATKEIIRNTSLPQALRTAK